MGVISKRVNKIFLNIDYNNKMNIAGQFQSKENAGWYAAIKSYTETLYAKWNS